MNQIYEDPDLYFLREKPFTGYESPAWLRIGDRRYKEPTPQGSFRSVSEEWLEQQAEVKRIKAEKKAAEREALRAAAWAAKTAEKAARAQRLAAAREEASRRFQQQRAEFRAHKAAQKQAKAKPRKPKPVTVVVVPAPVVAEEPKMPSRSRTEYWREYARAHKQKGTGVRGRTVAVAVTYMHPDGQLENFPSKSALAKAIGRSTTCIATALKTNCGIMADGGMVRVNG